MREITCPSGAVLKVHPAPFAPAKALYQAILREARGIPLAAQMQLAEVYKNLFCAAFASLEVEKCVWECMKKCTYNGGKGDLKIEESTFEPASARDDYTFVCMEIAKENALPFVKSLYAEYQRVMSMTEDTPK